MRPAFELFGALAASWLAVYALIVAEPWAGLALLAILALAFRRR